jgi:hypothetical protein
LSLILLSERWLEYTDSGTTGELPVGSAPAWAVRKTFPVLLPMTILLVAISTGVAAWRYYVILEDLQPDRQARSELGKYVVKGESERPVNLEAVCQWYKNGHADAELKLAMIS